MNRWLPLVALIALPGASCGSCGGPPEQCTELAVKAGSETSGRLSLWADGCRGDDDCAEVAVALSCYKGCPGAVYRPSVSDAVADLDALDQRLCGGSGCSVNAGCVPSHPVCRIGRCRMLEGPRDAGPSDAGAPDGG